MNMNASGNLEGKISQKLLGWKIHEELKEELEILACFICLKLM